MLPLWGQSGPGSDGNKRVLRIPQSSSITRTSPSDCLVSYPGHLLVGGLTLLQKSNRCILQPQPTGQRSIMELDGMDLINNDNVVLAFSVGLVGKKYIKCVSDIFTCGSGNYCYKTGEFSF